MDNEITTKSGLVSCNHLAPRRTNEVNSFQPAMQAAADANAASQGAENFPCAPSVISPFSCSAIGGQRLVLNET